MTDILPPEHTMHGFPVKQHMYITPPAMSLLGSDSSTTNGFYDDPNDERKRAHSSSSRLESGKLAVEDHRQNGLRSRKTSAPSAQKEIKMAQAIFSPEQLREWAEQYKRPTGKGSRTSIATMSSIMTMGNSVYEDAHESPSSFTDDDESLRERSLSIKDINVTVEPSPGSSWSRTLSQNGGSAPPLSPSQSWDESEARRRAKLDERRRSLLAEYSQGHAPHSDSATPSSSVIPLRRGSSALDSSYNDRRSSFSSPSSLDIANRADRRTSFHLKPLVLTPQRTIIVPPLMSPSASSMRSRISGEHATGMVRSDSSSSNRPLSPLSAGPSRRRSIGYIDTSAVDPGYPILNPHVQESPIKPRLAFGHQWQSDFTSGEISPGTVEVQDPIALLVANSERAFSQLETIPGTPQLDMEPPPASTAMSRNDLSVSSSMSELESSAPPSPPNFPLPPDKVPSRKSSMHSIRTAKASSPAQPPIPQVPRKKKRIPAVYNEHWNGEAFIEVDDVPASPTTEQAYSPVESAASRLQDSPFLSDAVVSDTGAAEAIKAKAYDEAAKDTKTAPQPISTQPQSPRRGSAGSTLRKLRRPDSMAVGGSSDASRRTSILGHAKSFAFERLANDTIKPDRRLSKSIENMRSARTTDHDGVGIWPPAENQQTKKLTAGPALADLSPDVGFDDPTASYFDDDDPYLHDLDAAYGAGRRSNSLLPRDPRAQVDAPDSFLGALLTSEPLAAARDRRDTFASGLSLGSVTRWSSHSESTTGTTGSEPSTEYSTTADSPKKGVGRFKNRLFSFGSIKKTPSPRKSRPSSTCTTGTTATTPPPPASPAHSSKKPITIGAHPRTSILLPPSRPDSGAQHLPAIVNSSDAASMSVNAHSDQLALRRPSRTGILQPTLEPQIEVSEDFDRATTGNDKQLLDAVLGNLPASPSSVVVALPQLPREQPGGRYAPIAIPAGGRRSSAGSTLASTGRTRTMSGASIRHVSGDMPTSVQLSVA